MKSIMTKSILCIIFFIMNFTYAGVTVSGTKFFFNQDLKKIMIKTINDNESDYLVKTEVKSDKQFIVSPPLMLLKKNQSNLVTIIPPSINSNQDKIFNLVITTIPKTTNSTENTINIAVRSNFKLVYRHKPLHDDIKKYLVLNINNKTILNNSDSYITFFLACNKTMSEKKVQYNIFPHEEISIPTCINETWATIVRDDNSVGPAIQLSLN